MSEYSFKAVIFDLDGVITQTAKIHSIAWKRMFDVYLKLRTERDGEVFKEFTHENDYLPFVDGKPRYKGVESFLISRGINIEYGKPSDSPDTETICGLGNKKDSTFNAIIASEGVMVYDSTVEMIEHLRNHGIQLGVASSSKNCKQVLEAASLSKLFGTRVDGIISAELHLKGKPEPDIFTTACDNLGVVYKEAIIVEDAVSGVQAGAKGGFGLVLGISRENNENELSRNGADWVIKDFSEITIDDLENRFAEKIG